MSVNIRSIFSSFSPYSWELSTREISKKVGIPPSRIHRMDTNTSPYLPEMPLEQLCRNLTKLRVNDYPDTSYFDLRRKISSYCGTEVNQIVVTNGADEALDIIAKTLLDRRDEVIIPVPTYSMYRVCSEIMDARVVSIPRINDFRLNLDVIKKKLTTKTKIIFLCSPNNPTGNTVSSEEMSSLLELSRDCTVVIDEAYYEFSGTTYSKLVDKYDNLLIVRTFSKAFSMAGVRVGYVISSQSSTERLNLVRPPNSLGVISIFLAQQSLEYLSQMRDNVKSIVAERNRMQKAMNEIKRCKVYPSEANFILFEPAGVLSDSLHSQLMKKGFVLRNFTGVSGIGNCLRVTVNTSKVNSLFLKTLAHLLQNR